MIAAGSVTGKDEDSVETECGRWKD